MGDSIHSLTRRIPTRAPKLVAAAVLVVAAVVAVGRVVDDRRRGGARDGGGDCHDVARLRLVVGRVAGRLVPAPGLGGLRSGRPGGLGLGSGGPGCLWLWDVGGGGVVVPLSVVAGRGEGGLVWG